MFATIGRTLKLLLIAVFSVAFVAFAVVNREQVAVNLFPLPYSAQMPAFLFAIVCFTLGVVVAGLTMSLKLTKSRHQLKSEHRRVSALQNEIKGIHAKQNTLPAAIETKA